MDLTSFTQGAADEVRLRWNAIEALEPQYFECACHSPEHTLRLIWDDEDNEIYAEVHLHHYQHFLKRLWMAVKYVCGYTCRYGHWDCFIMRPTDAHRLKQMLNKLEQGIQEPDIV
jgi:hypothetical protein